MGKGKIARYEQILLSPECFLKPTAAKWSNVVIVWERVNIRIKTMYIVHIIVVFESDQSQNG